MELSLYSRMARDERDCFLELVWETFQSIVLVLPGKREAGHGDKLIAIRPQFYSFFRLQEMAVSIRRRRRGIFSAMDCFRKRTWMRRLEEENSLSRYAAMPLRMYSHRDGVKRRKNEGFIPFPNSLDCHQFQDW